MKRLWKEGSTAKTCERSTWGGGEGKHWDKVVTEGSFCATGH